MRTLVSALLAIAVSSFGCAAPPPEEPAIDVEAERAALMDVDKAWLESVGDVDQFLSFFEEGATFLPMGQPLARGEGIRAWIEGLHSLPGVKMEWQATSAEVAEAADLGYTIGAFQLTVEQDGTPMVTVGKYVTTWGKQGDGSWKIRVDCFNADGPPTAVEGE